MYLSEAMQIANEVGFQIDGSEVMPEVEYDSCNNG